MKTNKFTLSQCQTDFTGSFGGLDFNSFIEATNDSEMVLEDPIVKSVFETEIDYGQLFAYCFRRFGYPNRGWDGYKELVSYLLKTPSEEMYLRVSPNIGNISSITFSFLVKREKYTEIDQYARKDQNEWRARLHDWMEARGLPDWMDEWLAIYNNDWRQRHPEFPVVSNWREVIDFPYSIKGLGPRPEEINALLSEFKKESLESYTKLEPFPEYRYRSPDFSKWTDDDPLKPLAEAAIIALTDLKTPVPVRDGLINALGPVTSYKTVASTAPSAGYPSGAMGNAAPKEFAQLHSAIVKLGDGNIKRGIKKLMDHISPLIGEESSPGRQYKP